MTAATALLIAATAAGSEATTGGGYQVGVELGASEGLRLAPAGGEGGPRTRPSRAPVFLRLEPTLRVHRDDRHLWVLGLLLPIERGPGFGLSPGARLVRAIGPVEAFLEGGPSALLQPDTRIGLAARGGTLWFPLGSRWLGLLGAAGVTAWWPPGGSEERGMTLDLRLGAAIRIAP